MAPEGTAEDSRVSRLSAAEIAREESEESFWERAFRNQVRQVLQALMRYTRFRCFCGHPSDFKEASQCDDIRIEGPLTLWELGQRNDKGEYKCVEDVRDDVRRIRHNVELLFPDTTIPAERRMRAHAGELVDKAEVKLDCIDEQVATMFARMRRRRERREAAQQRIHGTAAKESALPASGSAPKLAQGMATRRTGPLKRHYAPPELRRPEEQRPTQLPSMMQVVVVEEVAIALEELPGRPGDSEWLPGVLALARRAQRGLCAALASGPPHESKYAGWETRLKLKRLTDLFNREYAPPESLEGLTASSLLARRCEAFQATLQARGCTRSEAEKLKEPRQIFMQVIDELLKRTTLHRVCAADASRLGHWHT